MRGREEGGGGGEVKKGGGALKLAALATQDTKHDDETCPSALQRLCEWECGTSVIHVHTHLPPPFQNIGSVASSTSVRVVCPPATPVPSFLDHD